MTDYDARKLCESRKRCKILASKGSYFKPGQHGYVVAHSRAGGFHTLDNGVSRKGQLVFAVSKSKHMRGGALWFTSDALKFHYSKKVL